MPETHATSGPVTWTLNILFAGTMVFVVRSKDSDGVPAGYIEVLIPQVDLIAQGSGHSYKVATAKPDATALTRDDFNLYDMTRGSRYQLEGVEPSTGKAAQFAPDMNIFVPGPLSPDFKALLHCSLLLPPPKSITPMRVIKNLSADWFVDPKHAAAQNVIHSKHLALVNLLTYEFTDFKKLRIRDDSNQSLLTWSTRLAPPPNSTINVHVYAEPREWEDAEKMQPFDALVKLTTAQTLAFQQPQVLFRANPVVPGLTELEGKLDLPTLWPKTHTGFTRPFNCSPLVVNL